MERKLISLLVATALLLSLDLPAMAVETVEPYGEPWLSSVVSGMVTADLPKPELKDDFFLNVNYEWLRDTAMRPDMPKIGGLNDVQSLVDEQAATLFTDESIIGREAELAREFYQMFLDWDSRAGSREFLLEHLRPIMDIATLEDMTAYLTSEECMYYGYSMCQPDLGTNPKNPEEWMFNVGWPTLSMWDSAAYSKPTPYSTRLGKYHDGQANYVLQYAGFSEAEAAEILRLNLEFESLLAPYIMTEEEQFAVDAMERMLNYYTREELAALSPNFPLLGILDCYAFNPELPIVVNMPACMEQLNALYTEERAPDARLPAVPEDFCRDAIPG